jgi:hypothetical protein
LNLPRECEAPSLARQISLSLSAENPELLIYLS